VKEGLRDLYEKAKREQWNGTVQLAWDTPVDPEAEIIPQVYNPLEDYAPYKKLSEKQVREFRHAMISLQLSQFMHGEQGALIVASQLAGAVPWIDAKYYAATQTMDEARHVEVFARYLRDKLEWQWPINPNLKQLLDIIICDHRWDLKYLGMQILVEGLAMAAFAQMYRMAVEPLVRDVVHYVMKDESRHVAFGVISLKGFYDEMSDTEKREREEFVVEVCELMRDRLVGEEIAHHFGWPANEVRQLVLDSPMMKMFRQSLFARVVPNIKKLGLLSPRVRKGFEQLEIIQFEDFDAEAADRQIGLN
jgi:P-aminobenzoate N-oxygenase AurF